MTIHGQKNRHKTLSIQREFLLFLNDFGHTHNFTLSIVYQYNPNASADQKLAIGGT